MKLGKVFNHKFVLGSCNLIFMNFDFRLCPTILRNGPVSSLWNPGNADNPKGSTDAIALSILGDDILIVGQTATNFGSGIGPLNHLCHLDVPYLQLCGVTLLSTGFYLFTDSPRILLSRLLISATDQHRTPLSELEQPLFYYVAFGLTTAGLVAIIAALLGCWASCMNTYCVLTMYFLIILSLLIAEFGVCLMITAWPQCLGLNLNETAMVKALQGSYGVPGNEQFTAAMDLAQTIFECCAINTSINYDTSLWKLQSLGKKELTVPLTCCKLQNRYEFTAYLDPVPVNLTLCQALQTQDYEKSRHLDGCLHKIELWYREQYFLFLCAGLIIAVVEFCVLLSIILSCTKLPKKTSPPCSPPAHTLVHAHHPMAAIPMPGMTNRRVRDNIYERDLPTPIPVPTVRETYIQPKEYSKTRHEMPFQNNSHYYQISKSYLV